MAPEEKSKTATVTSSRVVTEWGPVDEGKPEPDLSSELSTGERVHYVTMGLRTT